jgi:hypothetical protein
MTQEILARLKAVAQTEKRNRHKARAGQQAARKRFSALPAGSAGLSREGKKTK